MNSWSLAFVEVDRSTEPLDGSHPNRIREKLRRYAELYDHAGEQTYQARGVATDGFRVLFLVPTESRANSILRLAQTLDLSPLVWVATHAILPTTGSLTTRTWRNRIDGPALSLLD